MRINLSRWINSKLTLLIGSLCSVLISKNLKVFFAESIFSKSNGTDLDYMNRIICIS